MGFSGVFSFFLLGNDFWVLGGVWFGNWWVVGCAGSVVDFGAICSTGFVESS